MFVNIERKKLLIAAFCLLFFYNAASAQTTAFNFQGRLNDGANPANGRYDLQFKLFDAITGGAQVGSTVDRPNLMVINGVFSTALDFGASAFTTSGNRFLEILVRPNGSPNAYVVLGARQQILSVPFAARAASATNADFATNAQNSVNATNATNATTAQNSLSLGGISANNYARLNFANQGDVSAANMSTTGYISIGGNTLQPAASNGLPKAMIYVSNFGTTILRCYNGVTGQSTGNCGFTVSVTAGLNGVYNINFGFPVNGRFISVTADNSTNGQLVNYGANFRFNGNNLVVFTFLTNNLNDTEYVPFMAIVY